MDAPGKGKLVPRQLGEKGRSAGGKAIAQVGCSVVGEGWGRGTGAGEVAGGAEGLYPEGSGRALKGFKLTSVFY